MRLSHNIYSLNMYSHYKKSLEEHSGAVSRISSGLKIQNAKDNPGKIDRNENLKIQILSNAAARSNIQDTNSMIQTFDSAMQQINNNLARLKQLVTSGANGDLQEEDKKKTQLEIDTLMDNIDYLAKNTQFNDSKLINGDGEGVTSLIGTLEDETLTLPKFDLTISSLLPNGIDVTDAYELAGQALSDVDSAITKVTNARAQYGALQSNLEDTYDAMGSIAGSLQQAQSSIGDADIAEEMLINVQTDILIKASIALMAQSNNIPQDALRVLENVRK